MLVSLKWLNQYVKIDDLTPQEFADLITLHSAEVESVTKVSNTTGVVVGYIESRIQHPDADKLSVCQVNIGDEVVQIVCGAKNVDAGQKVPVAINGAVLPGNFKIKKTKLRGQESNGMICSISELGIASNVVPEILSEGIWVLPSDAPIGKNAIEYVNFDDTIVELGLTPNRMDLLSMYGIANDVAAILNRPMKPISKSESLEKGNTDFTIRLETSKCSAYLGKHAQNIKVNPSDLNTQALLMATGNKPINNVVDLTNQILFTTGLPVHAFDADKLPTKEIVVREAKDGESVVTLDGQTRKLAEGDILITSGNEIIAIAGVMGSLSSSVDSDTKNILFEAAIFDRKQIRKTATRLNLRTNASARFEKGIHVERIYEASYLIEQAYPDTQNTFAGNFEDNRVEIKTTVEEINTRLGTNLFITEIEEIFKRLGLSFTSNGNNLNVVASTRMNDVIASHDLIEEIARIYGFNNIRSTLPAMNSVGGYTQRQNTLRQINIYAQNAGLQNVLTYSLVSEKKLNDFVIGDFNNVPQVSLAMPLSLEHAHMRKSLIPSLIDVLAYNKARQIKDVNIYEVGKSQFINGEHTQELTILAAALTGVVSTSKWQGKSEVVDFYTAKGALVSILNNLGYQPSFVATSDYSDFHPGQTANVLIDNKVVGIIGKIHPLMMKKYDVNDTFVFEINLSDLFEFATNAINYTPVSKFPAVSFDLALVVDKLTPVASLTDTIYEYGTNLLQNVEVFDVYTGIGLLDDKKSVALNVTFQDADKTLTDEDVTSIRTKILAALEKKNNAVLRA